MIVPNKHSVLANDKRYNYLAFDSVGQFNGFVDQESRSLNQHHVAVLKQMNAGTLEKLKAGSPWYGLPTPSGIDELNNHNSFLGISLLQQIKPKIKQHLAEYLRYLDTHVMPKPKVSYNDRGLGMFSFERAATGLYRSGKIVLGSPIEQTVTQLTIELNSDRIKTKVKNVYAYFEHKQATYPSIRIYLLAGANAQVEGNDLLYVGLACAELVEFLELRGVAVEVNVLLGSAFDNQVSLASIRIKRFQDPIDKNLLLLLSSDPRYFRYRGFKALIALSNHFGLNIPEGLGRMEPGMGLNFLLATDPLAFVFEQSYSLETAAQEVKRIITTYKTRMDHAGKA